MPKYFRLPNRQQTVDVSIDLDPMRLQNEFISANGGSISRQSRLANELAEKFPAFIQVWNMRKASIESLPWYLAGGDEKAKQIIKSNLNNLRSSKDSISFRRLLRHLQNAPLHGYSIAEIDWNRESGGANINGIRAISAEAASYDVESGCFYFETEDNRKLEAKHPLFIISQVGETPNRDGLVRPLAIQYIKYRHITMQYLRGIEKYGVAQLVAEVDDIMFEEGNPERDKLETALENWTYDGFAIVPKDIINFTFPTATAEFSAEPFRAELSAIDKEVARLVLGQDSTTISDNSNRSTAAVHNMVRRDILFSDVARIEEVIQEQIIRPLMIFNFGSADNAPKFKFDLRTHEDRQAVSAIAVNLASAGYEIDTAQLSAELGMTVTKRETSAP